MRLSFEEIQQEIKRVFMKYGLTEEKADICARIHTESAYDGIYSHGTNRVARFVDYIQKAGSTSMPIPPSRRTAARSAFTTATWARASSTRCTALTARWSWPISTASAWLA